MSAAPALPPGVAARFRAESILGRGGFATVWRARQLQLDRPVALKILHATRAEMDDQTARFLEEARITAQISHPHVMVVLDSGLEDGVAWIAYEHLEGPSLRAALEQGPLPWKKALGIAGQVASALEAAHAVGVLHRDIKPENVLEAGQDHWKVGDFGIARCSGRHAVQTQMGMVLGTPGYIAPELLTGTTAHRGSDVYATGVLLFELLTGRMPFSAPSPVELFDRMLKEDPPAASSLAPGVPKAVDDLLAAALALDPRGRSADAVALRERIEAALRKGRVVRGGVKVPVAPAGRALSAPRLAAGAGALLALAGMFFVALRNDEVKAPPAVPGKPAAALPSLKARVQDLYSGIQHDGDAIDKMLALLHNAQWAEARRHGRTVIAYNSLRLARAEALLEDADAIEASASTRDPERVYVAAVHGMRFYHWSRIDRVKWWVAMAERGETKGIVGLVDAQWTLNELEKLRFSADGARLLVAAAERTEAALDAASAALEADVTAVEFWIRMVRWLSRTGRAAPWPEGVGRAVQARRESSAATAVRHSPLGRIGAAVMRLHLTSDRAERAVQMKRLREALTELGRELNDAAKLRRVEVEAFASLEKLD